MIQVDGTIRLRENPDESAMAALLAMMEASRAEDGCLDHTFARDVSNLKLSMLFER